MGDVGDVGGAVAAQDPEFQLPEGSPLLISIGERLASVGLAEEAVASFLRGQDIKAAIDCCVLLNQWDQVRRRFSSPCPLAPPHAWLLLHGTCIPAAPTCMAAWRARRED